MHPVDVRIVMHEHNEVGSDVNIELAAPQPVLNAEGKRIVEFPGIMPNPTYAKVQEGAQRDERSGTSMLGVFQLPQIFVYLGLCRHHLAAVGHGTAATLTTST
jgi:hypothetical protein